MTFLLCLGLTNFHVLCNPLRDDDTGRCITRFKIGDILLERRRLRGEGVRKQIIVKSGTDTWKYSFELSVLVSGMRHNDHYFQ